MQNSYSPLYLWKDIEGLNKFLFTGYYDNILTSFGWQQVNIGIPLIDTTSNNIKSIKYLLEINGKIEPQGNLNNFIEFLKSIIPIFENIEYIVTYNPEKWSYTVYYFVDNLNKIVSAKGIVYNILHLSQ